MRKNDPIKHIMSDHVLSVQQGQPLSEVFKLLQGNNIHHVPVLDGSRLVGIVSATDLMKLSMGAQGYASDEMWPFIDAQYKLAEVMTSDPNTLSDSGVVRDAVEVLSSGAYHSLPVTDAAGDLVGLVTSTDLIRYLSEQY